MEKQEAAQIRETIAAEIREAALSDIRAQRDKVGVAKRYRLEMRQVQAIVEQVKAEQLAADRARPRKNGAEELAQIRRDEARREAIRETLRAAAREARKMGLDVRASTDRAGRVSSYYVSRAGERRAVRISDHEIPANERRSFLAEQRGRAAYTGYDGGQILIDAPRRAEWLRRAIKLALAGRDIANL